MKKTAVGVSIELHAFDDGWLQKPVKTMMATANAG